LIRGIYINSIFPGLSINIIGWLALGLSVFYDVLAFENIKITNKRIDVLPALITFLICLISLSRSNIICAFLLLGGVLLYIFKNYSILKKAVFLIGVFLLLSLTVYLSYDFLESSLQRFDERGFESTERSLFLNSYIEKLNLNSFLFGITSEQYPFFLLNGNFHNSFLGGHSSFGILFVVFLLFIIQLIIRKTFTAFFLVILALVLLIRSFTDTIMFIGDFDFIFFVLLYRIKKS